MDSLPKAHLKQNNLLDAIDVLNTTIYTVKYRGQKI